MAIVLFGATGHTGRMTAQALVRAGARPVLAGRDSSALAHLAEVLGGLETAVADATRPDGTIAALLDAGDVLVSTVGPFTRLGEPAVRAAVEAGAHYLDSAGEPAFVRRVFEHHGPAAADRCTLVTACGFEHVPGNLAGALALQEAGTDAARVDTATFVAERTVSAGTLRSVAGVAAGGSFAYRDGALRDERPAARTRSFDVDGRTRVAVSYGGSEHLALPRLAPDLREVDVWLGLLAPAPLLRAAPALSAAARLPGVRVAVRTAGEAVGRLAGRRRAPDADRAAAVGRCRVVAVASDRAGEPLARVDLAGPGSYRFTADILAWAAQQAAAGHLQRQGAAGPVEAFGLEALEEGCAACGLVRV